MRERRVRAMSDITSRTRTGGRPAADRSGFSGSPKQPRLQRLIQALRIAVVFKARRDAATLLLVVVSYWLFTIVIWRDSIFDRILDVQQSVGLRTSVIVLSIIGIFVIGYELAHPLLRRRNRTTKLAIAAASTIISAGVVIYWVNTGIFSRLIGMSMASPFKNAMSIVDFVIGNLIICITNILFPVTGCAFVFRVLHYAIAGDHRRKTKTWYTPEDLKNFDKDRRKIQ
jgi:hypothetical protein